MSQLLQELIVEILLWLPVKTLVRFKCVSKSWRDLIDSQDFIRRHLKRSTEAKTELHIIFTLFASNGIYSVRFGEVFNGLVTRPSYPWESLENRSQILSYEEFKTLETRPNGQQQESYKPIDQMFGSCNGLVCLKFDDGGLVLWNPFTRAYKKLPSVRLENLKMTPHYGFGHDHLNDDYKVVRIMEFHDAKYTVISNEVKVYSLKINSWRRVQSLPFSGYKIHGSTGTFFKGSLHWLMSHAAYRSVNPEIIVYFDLAVEEFHMLLLPEDAKENSNSSIEVIGERLCVCSVHFTSHVDVWMMEQYRAGDSWIKLYSVGCEDFPKSYGVAKPLEYSKDGDNVLFAHSFEGFLWYDLTGKSDKKMRFCYIPRCLNAYMCIESLVSLGGQSKIDAKKQNMQAKKKRLMLEGSSSGA